MENTENFLLTEDPAPHWYVAKGTQSVGPMRALDVYQKVLSGEITWGTMAWRPGQDGGWARISDLALFQKLIPKPPAPARPVVKPAVPASARAPQPAPPPPPEAESKIWYVYQNPTQYGPFTESEVCALVQSGRVRAEQTHVWKNGLPQWKKLSEVEVFASLASSSPAAAQTKEERRRAPRKPLVAKLLFAQGTSVFVGLCRDISVGGMQVLCEALPGPVGSTLKLNISPSGKKSASKSELTPFVAEGVIVRALEDGRGFSFRFQKISDVSKRAIERFVSESPTA